MLTLAFQPLLAMSSGELEALISKPPQKKQLARTLSLLSGCAVLIGTMIGSVCLASSFPFVVSTASLIRTCLCLALYLSYITP